MQSFLCQVYKLSIHVACWPFSLIVMRTVNNVCNRLVRSGIVQNILPAPCLCLATALVYAYILFAEEVKISVNTSVCHAGAYPRLGSLILLSAGRWRLFESCSIYPDKNLIPDVQCIQKNFNGCQFRLTAIMSQILEKKF